MRDTTVALAGFGRRACGSAGQYTPGDVRRRRDRLASAVSEFDDCPAFAAWAPRRMQVVRLRSLERVRAEVDADRAQRWRHEH